MAIVEIIVIAAHIFKKYRGSNIEIVVAFKNGQIGCDEFKRDKPIVGKSQIGKGFAFTGGQLLFKCLVLDTYGVRQRGGVGLRDVYNFI